MDAVHDRGLDRLTHSNALSARGSREFLPRSAEWLLHSGIQEENGGVARYYRADLGRNARISTEITGYAVSTFLELAERLHSAECLDAAIAAGRFLTDSAWRPADGVMPFEWGHDELPEYHTYFFDCGVIARGLLRLWKKTGEQRFLDIAVGCGESMLRDFVNETDIHPILELPSRVPTPRDGRWSRSSDVYQLKSALAWDELAQVTADERFEQAFEKVLARSLASHADFPYKEGRGARVMDRLHSYSYFLEALLARGDRAEVREALADGLQRAGDALREVRGELERSDVNGQILRVRLWADASGAVALDSGRAAEEASWAAAYQLESEDPRLDGGFCFGRRNGELTPYANPVSTGFCLQALALWEDHQRGRSVGAASSLI